MDDFRGLKENEFNKWLNDLYDNKKSFISEISFKKYHKVFNYITCDRVAYENGYIIKLKEE